MCKEKRRSLFCLMLTALLLFLSACGQEDGESGQENGETLLPISVNGKEIRVGETTVQTLLDEGFNVSWVDEEAVSLGEAVIARLEIHTAAEEDQSVLETISFDGVPITELTREKAGEKYPDWTGDEVMWLHYGLEYKYDLHFDMSTGGFNGFIVERVYDVDWNG